MPKKGPVYRTPAEKGRSMKKLSNNIRKVQTKINDYIASARDIRGYTKAAFDTEDYGIAALEKAAEYCANAAQSFEESAGYYDGGKDPDE